MKKTILYEDHLRLGAKMVEFAGYEMPIRYTSITDEHLAVRKQAGIFDVSHMGEIHVIGKEATELVNYIFTNNVNSMTANQVLYGMMCYENGGVVDDLLVYKYNDQFYLLVVNASNVDKDFEWIQKQNRFDADVINKSEDISEVALQGPLAEAMLQKATEYDLSGLTFFTFDEMPIFGYDCLVSRTGYTGEDGFEIYGDHDAIRSIFNRLLEDNPELLACGLGCRDTLRFEVALPLYGNELSADITPIEAGLNFAVSFDKNDYIGKSVLEKQKRDKPKRRIVGLQLEGKGILRHGYDVYHEDTRVGVITTGYIAPSTNESVALALIDKPYDKMNQELAVEIRNKRVKVKVRSKKFYDKKYHK